MSFLRQSPTSSDLRKSIFHLTTRLLHKPSLAHTYKAGIPSLGLNRKAHLPQFQKPKHQVPNKKQKGLAAWIMTFVKVSDSFSVPNIGSCRTVLGWYTSLQHQKVVMSWMFLFPWYFFKYLPPFTRVVSCRLSPVSGVLNLADWTYMGSAWWELVSLGLLDSQEGPCCSVLLLDC